MSRVKRQFARLASAKNIQILQSLVLVTTMAGLASFAGIGRELTIAYQFGTASVLDAFLAAFVIPMFAVSVMGGSSFIGAIFPTYIQVNETQGAAAARRLFSTSLVLGGLLLLATVVVLAAAAPWLLSAVGFGFDPDTRRLSLTLYYWLLPVVMLTGVRDILTGAVNAGKRFGWPSLVPAITPVWIVCALLLAGDKWGIFAIVWATLAGGVTEVCAIAFLAWRKGIPLLPRWFGMTPELRVVAAQYVPQISAGFLMGGTILVDRAMASTLEPGSIAVLNFSNKLIGLITGLGTVGVGTVMLPHFSEMVAQRDWAGVQDTYGVYARLILLVTVPVTAVSFVLSEPLVALLYERGSFTREDTEIVGWAQAMYLLQIPFFVLSVLTVRLIASLKHNSILTWSALTNLILNVVLNLVFMKYMGVAGIALATSGVYLYSAFFLYIMLRRRAPHVMTGRLGASAHAS